MPRILVTDDEELVRDFMAAVLRQSGYVVVETRSAREALDCHGADPVDLIITDMVMKEMDGTELLRRMSVQSPQTPVVAISGARHGTMYLNMARMIGAKRVLAKPFTADELIEAVDDALQLTETRSADIARRRAADLS